MTLPIGDTFSFVKPEVSLEAEVPDGVSALDFHKILRKEVRCIFMKELHAQVMDLKSLKEDMASALANAVIDK